MKQTGSVFATHAHSAYRTISLTLRNLQHVLCYLPTWLEFFFVESLLWIGRFRLEDSCVFKFFDATTFV